MKSWPSRADVEEPHPERGRSGEAGERERRRRDQRLAERAAVQERRVDDLPVARQRVVTRRVEDEPGREEREDERADRDGNDQPARLAQPALNPHADPARRPSAGRSPRRPPPARDDLADDRALVHDRDRGRRAARISSRSSLMRSTRDAVCGGLAQVRVHRLDRADVEPARRRRGDEQPRLAGELAREHDLLQVAAREQPRRRAGPGRGDAVALDQLDGALANAPEPEQRPVRRARARGSDFSARFDAMLRLGATPVPRRSSGT